MGFSAEWDCNSHVNFSWIIDWIVPDFLWKPGGNDSIKSVKPDWNGRVTSCWNATEVGI